MKQFNTLVLAVLVLLTACKNPLKELNDFKLNINSGALINPSAVLSFVKKGQTGLVTSGLKVSITGMHAEYVYDELGTKDFQLMPDGKIKLILSPRLIPNAENPATFTVRVEGDGIFPFEQDVFLFDKSQVQELEFNLEPLNNLSPDKRHETKTLSFLGKKGTDTLEFVHTNAVGIQFTYKFPVKGAKLIATYRNRFQVEEARQNIIPIYSNRDTSFWVNRGLKDTLIESTEFLINNNGKFPLNGRIIKVVDWVEVKERIIEKFVKVNSIEKVWYEQDITDTIPLEPLDVEVNSSSSQFISLSGFVNEDGVEIDKPAKFEDCTLFPQLIFKTKSNGTPVTIVYNSGGPVVSVQMPSNEPVNLFLEGVHFERTTGQSLYTSLIIPSNSIRFKANGQIDLENNMKFVQRMFFFKRYSTGCGFSNVLFDTKTIDLNSFEVNYAISTPKISLRGRLFGNNRTVVRVPAFSEENSHTARVFVDHPQNRCEGGQVLYDYTQTISSPCNYVSNPFVFMVNYNGSSFLSRYAFYPVEVSAKLVCKTGAIVTLPTQSITYERQGCASSKGNFTLVGGEGEFSLIGNSIYKITATDPNTKMEISNDLPLYLSNTTGYTLEGIKRYSDGTPDEIAYRGSVRFDPINKKFVLDVEFQNKVFKFKIPGCN